MKLVKKLTVIAISSLLMFSIAGMNVFAASTTQDGLEVSLTTDKETYLKDEKITATLSVTNTNEEDITNLSMETIIPDGYYIFNNGNTDLSATVLKSKESVSLSTEFVPDSFRIEPVKTDTDEKTSEERPTKDDKPNDPSTAQDITPVDNNTDDTDTRNGIVDTSDSSWVNIIMCIVLICVSASVIILLVKRKSGKRFLSFVVCISLVGSIAAIIPIQADALQTKPRSVSIEESVKANGATLTLSANVRYEISGENLFKGNNSDEQVIVYFFKPDDWDDPYINFYSADSNEESAVFADMHEVSDGWFGYTIENCKAAKVAFTDKSTRIPEIAEVWLDAKGIMWYKSNIWCDSETDTDNDQLPDYMELLLGSNINIPDSDNDGLPDSFEALTLGTDPTGADTDNNNIIDADEDTDSDGLTNITEFRLGTDPTLADTDGDGLDDGYEVNKYHTELLNPDTDGDGANDGWEINNGYDPLTPDASFTVTLKAVDKENNLNASVTAEVSGSQTESLNAEFLESTFYLNPTIEGYIGKGLELSVNDEVNNAELEFTFDESLLDNDDFVPTIYYYNEETQCLEELETTTTGNVSTAHLTHFSTYILLNKTEFEKVWKNEIKKPGETVYENIRVAFVVDCSGSMDSKLSDTKAVLNSFVNILDERDKAAVICFDSSASVACDLTNDKNQLQNAINRIYASGLTSIYLGIEKALDLLISDSNEYYDLIIVITDGYDVPSTTYNSHYSSLVNTAQSHNINIYTVGIGSVDTSILTQISANTNATYYHANVISELENKIEDIKEETIDYTTDYNEDGITDYYTQKLTSGELRYGTHAFVFGTYDSNGKYHPATYEQVQANDDFDDDTLKNGEEIKIVTDSLGHPYVKFFSDPSSEDSDGDDLLDINDPVNTSKYNVGNPLAVFSSVRLSALEEEYEHTNNNNELVFSNRDLQETRDSIIMLQKCLEYLGYLDLENNPYGRLGGNTYTALYLYRVNHRFYNNNNKVDYDIDDITYYSIIRSALQAGFNIDNTTLLNNTNAALNKQFRPSTVQLKQLPYSVSVESSLGKANEKIYIYDLSTPLDGILKYGAQDSHFTHYYCNYSLSPVERISFSTLKYNNSSHECFRHRGEYSWLISNVKNDAKYDIKREKSWNNLFKEINLEEIPFFHANFPFQFHNEEINAEIFGNILYGFLGNAGGFSEWELSAGGSIYSLITEHHLDNQEDSDSISKGYNLYENVKHDYFYIHIT